jgi:phage-related holin
MGLDIMTGLVYAWESGTFKSSRMREGLGKKFGELTYICIGAAATVAMGLPHYILIGISTYILFMELMSVCENCDKLGAPLPKFVKKALSAISDSLQNDDLPEILDKADKLNDELKER